MDGRLSDSSFGHSGWIRIPTRAVTLLCFLAPPLASQARPPRVAIILDRETSRFQPLFDAFQRELLGFFRPGEITLLPPVAGRRNGVRASRRSRASAG